MLKFLDIFSKQSFKIEDVSLSQLPVIHELDKHCFGSNSYSFLVLRQLFELSGAFWSCVVIEGKLIGYLIAAQKGRSRDTAWLLAYGVEKKYRNHGLGIKLLNNLNSKCLNAGINKIYSTVIAENTSSMIAMNTAGYIIERKEIDYFGEKEDRLILSRDLTNLGQLKKLGVSSYFKGYASGNPTLIVLSRVSEANFVEVDRLIKREFEDVEQVGFLDVGNKIFTMAGHEFCGNASRIAANYLLKPESEGKIKVSGLSSLAFFEKNGKIVSLQISLPMNSVTINPNGISRIKLEGISFLAIENAHEIAHQLLLLSLEDLKSEAFKLFGKNKIDGDKACGLLFYSRTEDSIKLSPYIFISESDSFSLETSCSSGSIAISLLLKEKGLNPESVFNIEQPSGEFLNVKIVMISGELNASVEGPIDQDEVIEI